MHDVLRQRLLRKIETLPEEKIYQVLDYIEFLESKYATAGSAEASGLQRFAENIQDRMRKKAMNPETIREAFQLISAADKVLSGVSSAGKQLLDELAAPLDEPPTGAARTESGTSRRAPGAGPDRSPGPARRDPTPTATRGPDEPPPAPRRAPTDAAGTANPGSGPGDPGSEPDSSAGGDPAP